MTESPGIATRVVGLVFGAVVAGVLLGPAEALACAVCYGDPDSSQVAGLNRAIWALLAVIGVVQVGFVAMFAGFIRRARRSSEVDEAFVVNKGVGE